MTRLLLFFFLFCSYAGSAQFSINWEYPKGNQRMVPLFGRTEIGIRTDMSVWRQIESFLSDEKGGLNPYEASDIRIYAQYIAPDGREFVRDAFFYQAFKGIPANKEWTTDTTSFPFRVRFAADMNGPWKVKLFISIKNEPASEIARLEFNVVASTSKGFLRKSNEKENNPYYIRSTADNQVFFAVGENITHSEYVKVNPASHARHKKWLKQLADYGGNFVRLELGAQNFLVDWENIYNYSNRLDEACGMDELVDMCEKRGIYFILFSHHVEFHHSDEDKAWPDRPVQWNNNSYHRQLNLKEPMDFFRSDEVLKHLKRRYRYVLSRWGYSPSFFMYEFSEVDNMLGRDAAFKNIYMNDQQARLDFLAFFLKIKKMINEELGYSNIHVVTSFANSVDFEKGKDHLYNNQAFTFTHKYGEQKDENFEQRYLGLMRLRKTYKMPYMVEEMGPRDGILHCVTPVQFHNDIWATSFMGSFGCGMHWWWDRGIHDNHYYRDFKPLSEYFKSIKLSEYNFEPKTWSDKPKHSNAHVDKRKVEIFYLQDKDGKGVFGWIHNATSFWRNEKDERITQLIEQGYLNQPCVMEDGDKLGCAPPCWHAVDYAHKSFVDKYREIIRVEKMKFQFVGLKKSLGTKKATYKLTYISTYEAGKILGETEISSSSSGKISVVLPTLGAGGAEPRDYAFKLEYIGDK